MVKTLNGRVTTGEAVREKLSPAESSFKRSSCEVHPGVDSVSGI